MKKSDVNSKKAILEIEELYTLNERFSNIKKQYEEKSKRLITSIKNYMYSNGDLNFLSFKRQDGTTMQVKKISPKKIVWNPDKIEERLGKELSSEIIQKIYMINDFDGLVKYLKSCGVNPKKFKSFITVEKKVNDEIIKQKGDLGEITLDDLKGCYEVKEIQSYLKLGVQEEE